MAGRHKTPDSWPKIRREAIRKDRQRCQRCGRGQTYERATVHHITPRSEGGKDNPDNLITLCVPCHDFVEIHDPPLRSRLAIVGSYEGMVVKQVDEVHSPDWHSWVYGGARPPY